MDTDEEKTVSFWGTLTQILQDVNHPTRDEQTQQHLQLRESLKQHLPSFSPREEGKKDGQDEDKSNYR